MIDFNKIIDDYLWRELRPKQAGRYYPSEVGSCLRKVWYSYRIPKETTADLRRLFHAGNLMHEFVVSVIKSERTKEVELLSAEFPIILEMNGFTISGRADDLVMVKLSGKSVIVEVKSEKTLDYRKSPEPGHVMQLQLYMHATGVHNGMLLYIERVSLHTKSFEVPYDEKAVENILARFQQIHASVSGDTAPPPESRLKPEMRWQCRYCPWRAECYEETPPSREAP